MGTGLNRDDELDVMEGLVAVQFSRRMVAEE